MRPHLVGHCFCIYWLSINPFITAGHSRSPLGLNPVKSLSFRYFLLYYHNVVPICRKIVYGSLEFLEKVCMLLHICFEIATELQPFNRTMNAPISKSWDGVERRTPNGCRRRSPERRSDRERRHDRRKDPTRRRTLKEWIRSLTHARLGVDRRKGTDQRLFDRRSSMPRSLLTQEELHDLLN